MYAFEIPKGFPSPISVKPIDPVVPHDLRNACDQPRARRNQVVILRSKSVTEVPIAFGDFVEVYRRNTMKREEKVDPKLILSLNQHASSVTVSGRNGSPALRQESFA